MEGFCAYVCERVYASVCVCVCVCVSECVCPLACLNVLLGKCQTW